MFIRESDIFGQTVTVIKDYPDAYSIYLNDNLIGYTSDIGAAIEAFEDVTRMLIMDSRTTIRKAG